MVEHTQYISEDELQSAGSTSRTQRLTDKLCPLFADAFRRLDGGESITWELTPTTVPNPEYDPRRAPDQTQFLMILFFYADLSGAVPGTVIMSTADLAPYGWDQGRVDEVVRRRIQELLDSRSAQLRQLEREVTAEVSPINGQPARNRIVTPGQL